MNIDGFDLNLLKTFDALFAEGSVTKAAERLGVTQPATSAALRRLREAFNDPLFIRAGHRLEPTTVALELRPEVDRALGAVGGMLDFGKHFDPAQLSDTFWLSGSDFFSDLLLPPFLERLRLTAPNVNIVYVDQVFGTTLGALEDGTVDIAFWPKIDMPKWVNRAHLLTTRFELIARKGHQRLASAGIQDGEPIPLDLFCDLSHVHFSPDGRALDEMDHSLARRGRSRRIIATVPTFAGVVSSVLGSDVMGALPIHLVDRIVSHGEVTRHPLPMTRSDIPLMMIWHHRADTSPSHRWVREQLIASVEDIAT